MSTLSQSFDVWVIQL